jgi:glutaredoxin
MTQATAVTLYTRTDCHLCELAKQMLEACGVCWQAVDIDTDLQLIRKYSNHIPVLYRADVDGELFWPFDPVTLQDFLQLEI